VVTAAAAMSVAARLSYDLPPGPVPVTLQSLAVLLAGSILGPWRAALAVLIYIAAGAAGLPVFAGGHGGWQRLTGPTGGYLLGFLPATLLSGWLAVRASDRTYRGALATLLGGHGVILLFGVSLLSRFTGGLGATVDGLLPFLPGAALKSMLGALLMVAWRKRPLS
jgi:biotin transport system substrate-specific component